MQVLLQLLFWFCGGEWGLLGVICDDCPGGKGLGRQGRGRWVVDVSSLRRSSRRTPTPAKFQRMSKAALTYFQGMYKGFPKTHSKTTLTFLSNSQQNGAQKWFPKQFFQSSSEALPKEFHTSLAADQTGQIRSNGPCTALISQTLDCLVCRFHRKWWCQN